MFSIYASYARDLDSVLFVILRAAVATLGTVVLRV